VLLAVLFIALLPLRRQMEIPLSIFALSLPFLATRADRRPQIREASRFILPLFLCVWIPMLISCLDSLYPYKSWWNTVPALRYVAAAIAIAVLMRSEYSRELFLRFASWLLLFWAADGYFQLAFGHDFFGVPMNPDRLNALFYSRYQFYGPTLAFLSPLALQHMRCRWPNGLWILGFAFIFGAVLIAGMRAGWVMMVVVMIAFMVPLLRDPASRWQALILPVAVAVSLAVSILVSPLLQERLVKSSQAFLGSEQALDEATSYRLPIFLNALAMYRDHLVNGVGVRAYGTVYPDYAAPEDPHILMSSGDTSGYHAHNLVLEFMSDTGTIGLIGLLAALTLAWRYYRRLDDRARAQAFPYAVSLLAIVFPFNSHFSFFGVYTSSIVWVLIGLMAAAGISGANRTSPAAPSGSADEVA
jgi:O-antigen ligase